MDTRELDLMCKELILKKSVITSKEKEVKDLKDSYKDLEKKLLGTLEELDKSEYSGSFGKIKTSYRTYFKMADKEKVMNWLKERGDYENIVSVNANTFSGYCNQLVKEKREEGDHVWLPPGVEDSTSDRATIKIEGAK